MKKNEFKITIEAPKEKVWNTLWNDATYREWTSAFAEGSRAETDWKQGSKVLFLDAKNSGMFSTVAESRPFEFMSFKHLGIVKNGVEDLDNAESKIWSGALENYSLQTRNNATELTVNFSGAEGISKEMENYFINAWPKALEKLKKLAEKN